MASVMPPPTRKPMAEVQQILCPICHKPNPPRAKFCMHCQSDVLLNNDGPLLFKITNVIKEGGQGAVYQAVAADRNGQPHGDSVYAVKEMLDRFTDPKEEREAIERFEEEAQLLQRLSHPRIPRIYASFKDEERQYLVMDFVRGKDMEDIIRERGALPEGEVLTWADQLCDVLNYLHNHRPEPIIFRDMKPSNIMVEPDGNVKLIDFGIAKVFQRAQRGTQIGTPGYAPPEQYQGLAAPTSDIYALAATLHHMLTGRDPRDEPPFSFPPVYGLRPTVSKRTSDALQKALQMKPEDRFQSVAEFRAALRPLPAAQPQVRVAQSTRVLPPQPQTQAPAQSPTQAQPATSAARPAAPAVPATPVTAPPAATPAKAPAAQPRRRGGFLRGFMSVLVLALVLSCVGGGVYLFSDQLGALVGQYIPGAQTTPTTAPQRVYVPKGTFTLRDQEIIVPTGQDVRAAFLQTFIQVARTDPQFGPDAITSPNAPPAFIGDPEKIADEANGTRYRATVQGLVLVPQ